MTLQGVPMLETKTWQFATSQCAGLALFVLLGIFGTFSPANAQAPGGTSHAEIKASHVITLTPTYGSPDDQVMIDLKEGSPFERGHSRISFSFEDPSHYAGGIEVPTVFDTSSKLLLRVPIHAGCGFYQVAVTTTTKVGNRLKVSTGRQRFDVRNGCKPVPRISALSSVRGLPGETLTVLGTNLRPGVVVRFFRDRPTRSTEIERPTRHVTTTQLAFTLPVSEVGCGHTMIWVQDPAIQPSSNALPLYFSCDRYVLDVLSYNIKMLVDDPRRGSGKFNGFRDEMAKIIPTHHVIGDHDVIILQEAFSDSHVNSIVRTLAQMYPHKSRKLGFERSVGGVPDVEQEGGVLILSKWPIDNYSAISLPGSKSIKVPGDQRLFNDACAGFVGLDFGIGEVTCKPKNPGRDADCCADKGVLYVKINKEGQNWHVFGTHLDSGEGGGDRSARLRQLGIIRGFTEEVPSTEPVVIAGDFNLQRRGTDYRAIFRELDVTHPPGPNGEYAQATTPGGDYTATGNCPGPGGSYIDYVFYSNRHLRIVAASNEVLTPCDARGRNLSDHYPVVGRFHLRPIPLEAVPMPTPPRR